MEIICKGFRRKTFDQDAYGEKLFGEEVFLEISEDNKFSCNKKCQDCVFEETTYRLYCEGRDECGREKYSGTVRVGEKKDKQISCEEYCGDTKCAICLLKLEKISGR